MVECVCVKVLNAFKIVIQLGLFVAFVVLSSLAFRDLLSDKTTFNTWHEYNKAPVLPSFTICFIMDGAWSMFDEYSLASNRSDIFQNQWASFNVKLLYQNGTVSMNSTIEDYYFTEKYCKPDISEKNICMPCETFSTHSTVIDEMERAQVVTKYLMRGIKTL